MWEEENRKRETEHLASSLFSKCYLQPRMGQGEVKEEPWAK